MYQSYPGWGGYPGQYMHMNPYYILMGLRPIVNQVRRKFESGVPFDHVAYETASIGYLIGRGYPFYQALSTVEMWKQRGYIPYRRNQ